MLFTFYTIFQLSSDGHMYTRKTGLLSETKDQSTHIEVAHGHAREVARLLPLAALDEVGQDLQGGIGQSL